MVPPATCGLQLFLGSFHPRLHSPWSYSLSQPCQDPVYPDMPPESLRLPPQEAIELANDLCPQHLTLMPTLTHGRCLQGMVLGPGAHSTHRTQAPPGKLLVPQGSQQRLNEVEKWAPVAWPCFVQQGWHSLRAPWKHRSCSLQKKVLGKPEQQHLMYQKPPSERRKSYVSFWHKFQQRVLQP